MLNISLEVQENFKKENGMTIEEAIAHINQWINDGSFDRAEAGIIELKKYAPDLPELTEFEKKIRANKSEIIQNNTDKTASIKGVDTSCLEDVTESEKMVAAIGYLAFFAPLPLALKPNSEYCKFHGKQALAMQSLFFLLIFFIMPFTFFGAGMLFCWIQLFFAVLGFNKAKSGKLWNMPMFGEIARKLPID